MFYLILAILGSSAISVIMRVSGSRVSSQRSMLAFNYLTCLIFSALYCAPGLGAPARTLYMGGFNGILYLASFLLLQDTTRKSGVVLSTIFMKLGLLVPFILSVVLFRESPTAPQMAGFLLAVAAIVGIYSQKSTGLKGGFLPLLLLLLLGGSANAMSKVYQRYGIANYENQFLFYTFLSAFLLCALLVLIKKERPGKQDIFWGIVIGIPNFFASKCLLQSLFSLPAVVAYPTFSACTITLVTIVGVLFFRERPTAKQWISLGGMLAAIILLNT